MNEPALNTPSGPQALMALSTVCGCFLFVLAYGLPLLAGLLPGEYRSPQVVNAVFVLCSVGCLGTAVGFVVGCLGAAAQWLIGRRQRNRSA
jgi:hypothetical protein